MSDQIERALREKPLSVGLDNTTLRVKELLEFLNREVLPVLREARAIINRRFGQVQSVDDDYSFTQRDEMVFCSVASKTMTLPDPALRRGVLYVVNTSGAGTVTVDAVTGNVDGASSVTVSTGAGFVSDDTGWWSV